MGDKVKSLISEIIAVNKFQEKFLESSIKLLSDEDLNDLNLYLSYCLKTGNSLTTLVESYNLIVVDTLKEQVYFKKHGCYRYSKFSEVKSLVYFNDDYMKKYMIGLALTNFLWPNHVELRKFFRRTLPKGKRDGIYLEIGPGHGFYFITAMRYSLYSHFIGVDISPTSVELTRNIISSKMFGSFSDYEIIERDFLDLDLKENIGAIVMGEVLEHVENPINFLKKIRSLVSRHSYIFITTCINSPAIDHIYLYTSEEELRDQISTAGLSIKTSLIVPYLGTTIEKSLENKLPINVAMILEATP